MMLTSASQRIGSTLIDSGDNVQNIRFDGKLLPKTRLQKKNIQNILAIMCKIFNMLGNFCPKLGCGKKSLKSDKEILVASYFACYPFFEGEVWCLTILPKEIK